MAFLTGGLLDGLSKSFEITEGSGDRTTDSNEAIRAAIDSGFASVGGSPIIIAGTCDADMGASTTVIDCLDLAGYGNDYFNNSWWMRVVKNDNSIGAAPTGEEREVTDYVSATGVFTCTAFSANVEATDEIILVYKNVAGMKYQEYTSGSGNWTCPLDTYFVDVLIVSAGGGGGGATTLKGGGGGGGGAIGFYKGIKVTPGNTYAYSIGAGGAGGTGYNHGSTGGSTTFMGKTLTGGLYGKRYNEYTGGNGAACETLTGGTGGNASTDGGNSSTSLYGAFSGAGGGGGSDSAGADGGASFYGAGGASPEYGGGGGASFGAGGAGGNSGGGVAGGANTGAGGGGSSNSASAGGTGGSGYILITWR